MSAACSGWRSAAKPNREWIAASRALRVRMLLPRSLLEVVEERADHRRVQVGDVRAGTAGCRCAAAAKLSSSRRVSR